VDENGNNLWLHWQAEQTTLRDLTSFVHLIDSRNRRVGQADKAPGDGTFRTPWWKPGERVAQIYTPTLSDPCAGGETVRVVAGWYEYLADGRRRPRTGAPGDTALAGALTLPWRSTPADQLTIPTPTGTPITGTLSLAGYGLEDEPFLGAPLTLDLYFSAEDATDSVTDSVRAATVREQLSLVLTASTGQTTTLWSGALAPGATWNPGELLCRRLHLDIPADLAPAGDFQLDLVSGAARAPIATLALQPSNRTFALPASPTLLPSGARLGDQVELAAYTTAPIDTSLAVTLAWHALARPSLDATAFVHLLDANGNIVAQSDQAPGRDRPTGQWVAGEYVLDTHLLALPPDLPAGDYSLAAGLYDPISGQRLPAISAGGQPYADNAVRFNTIPLPAPP
jgi:hypothetical protein